MRRRVGFSAVKSTFTGVPPRRGYTHLSVGAILGLVEHRRRPNKLRHVQVKSFFNSLRKISSSQFIHILVEENSNLITSSQAAGQSTHEVGHFTVGVQFQADGLPTAAVVTPAPAPAAAAAGTHAPAAWSVHGGAPARRTTASGSWPPVACSHGPPPALWWR